MSPLLFRDKMPNDVFRDAEPCIIFPTSLLVKTLPLSLSWGRLRVKHAALAPGVHRTQRDDCPTLTYPPPPLVVPFFLSECLFFSVSFCPCLPGPLGLDKLPPTPPPCPLTA